MKRKLKVKNDAIDQNAWIYQKQYSGNIIWKKVKIHWKNIGVQKRRIRCMWGNKACDGYSNQDETEQFCSQEDVKDYFCDRFQGESYPLKWSRRVEKIKERSFK